MKNEGNKKHLNNNGITLIALVITIIVLLILAGVSIALLTGENGILNQANIAREENEIAAEKEKIELLYQDWLIEEYKGTSVSDFVEAKVLSREIEDTQEARNELTNYIMSKVELPKVVENIPANAEPITAFSQTENIKIQDEYKNIIVIPAGFGLAADSGTDVTKGIVIEDAKSGNQFVWIPVNKINDGTENGQTILLSRYEFDENGTATPKGLTDDINSANSYNESYPGGDNVEYFEEQTNTLGNAVAENLNDFIEKTITAGGYYIGRYESGNNGSGTVIINKNASAYVGISQVQASEKSIKMYESETKYSSDLINSLAWDTALVYIQTFSNINNYSQKTSTGSDEEILKIENMLGGKFEWSTETSSETDGFYNYPSTHRGTSGGETASYRFSDMNNSLSNNIAFRTILYILN